MTSPESALTARQLTALTQYEKYQDTKDTAKSKPLFDESSEFLVDALGQEITGLADFISSQTAAIVNGDTTELVHCAATHQLEHVLPQLYSEETDILDLPVDFFTIAYDPVTEDINGPYTRTEVSGVYRRAYKSTNSMLTLRVSQSALLADWAYGRDSIFTTKEMRSEDPRAGLELFETADLGQSLFALVTVEFADDTVLSLATTNVVSDQDTATEESIVGNVRAMLARITNPNAINMHQFWADPPHGFVQNCRPLIREFSASLDNGPATNRSYHE